MKEPPLKGKLILRGLCEPKSIFSLDFCKSLNGKSVKEAQSNPDGQKQILGPTLENPLQPSAKKSVSLSPDHDTSVTSVRMTKRVVDDVGPEPEGRIEKMSGNRDAADEFIKLGRFLSLQRALLQKSPIALIWVLQAAKFREHLKDFQKAFLKYDKESKKNIPDCEKITKYMPTVSCEMFRNTYLEMDNNGFNFPKVWSRAPFPVLLSPLVRPAHYDGSSPNGNNYKVGTEKNTPKAFSRLSQHITDFPIEAVLLKRKIDDENRGRMGNRHPDFDGNHKKSKRVYDLIKQRKSGSSGRFKAGHTLQDQPFTGKLRTISGSNVVAIPQKRLFDMMGGSNEKKIIGKFSTDDHRPDSRDEKPSRRLTRPRSDPGFLTNSIEKRLFDVMHGGGNLTVSDKKFVRRFQRFDDRSRGKRVYDVFNTGDSNPQIGAQTRFTNSKLQKGARFGDNPRDQSWILEMEPQNDE